MARPSLTYTEYRKILSACPPGRPEDFPYPQLKSVLIERLTHTSPSLAAKIAELRWSQMTALKEHIRNWRKAGCGES